MGPNILITGGAGYIGSALVQKIAEAKKLWKTMDYNQSDGGIWRKEYPYPGILNYNKIVVYDNLMYRQTSLTNYCYKNDFFFVNGDVRDVDKLLEYIKEADIIIPLAAIVGYPACDKDKRLAQDVNTQHIKLILANKKDTAKVIYPNTNSGYGIGEKDVECTEDMPLNPISWYGKTKCDSEKLVLADGGVSLRLATVFGVSTRMRLDLLVNDFTYKAFRDGYIVLFEHEFRRNFIHVQDVALAFLFSIHHYEDMKGNAYNLGMSDCNISKLELCERIKLQVPNFSIQLDDINKDPDKRDYIVSNAKIEKLGWRPHYSLDDGITELLKSFEIYQGTLNTYTNL